MPDTAIQAENLSKAYQIGLKQEVPDTLTGALRSWISSPATNLRRLRRLDTLSRNGDADDIIWALRDVSFDVGEGEVVGIIGRNGAGKSTLLKILSRITEPTAGRASIHGRVASLLEVGTGFHPELTGRENVYMNGTILGMKKLEIDRKFDAIVDFSGIEKFLDTPIKRYSSGMKVRLAFSVAAHLEPEILIIDEVLSVGDAEFQSKCLGKMEDVAGSGRTVLFVSHNMPSVGHLCGRAFLLEHGKIVARGKTKTVISRYLSESAAQTHVALEDRKDRIGDGKLRFHRVRFSCGNDELPPRSPATGAPMVISIEYSSDTSDSLTDVAIAITLLDSQDRKLFVCDTQLLNRNFDALPQSGQIDFEIPSLPLAGGTYRFNIWSAVRGVVADYVINAGCFSVTETSFFKSGRTTDAEKHGPFIVDFSYRLTTA